MEKEEEERLCWAKEAGEKKRKDQPSGEQRRKKEGEDGWSLRVDREQGRKDGKEGWRGG